MSRPESDKPLSAQEREDLEGRYTFRRIVELELDPVHGRFDSAHLKEINRRIFQDLPSLGFNDFTPGQYRPAVAPGKDWIKNRRLSSVGASSYVAYSSMGKAVQSRLDKVLENANPAELSKLKTGEFTEALANLYTEIDYIHPFRDGNSRTLRAFTKQLAQASGYELDWERFNHSAASRDALYVARDNSVNALALPHIQREDTKCCVVFSLDQLQNNRSLPDLLHDAIQANRIQEAQQKTQAVVKPDAKRCL